MKTGVRHGLLPILFCKIWPGCRTCILSAGALLIDRRPGRTPNSDNTKLDNTQFLRKARQSLTPEDAKQRLAYSRPDKARNSSSPVPVIEDRRGQFSVGFRDWKSIYIYIYMYKYVYICIYVMEEYGGI